MRKAEIRAAIIRVLIFTSREGRQGSDRATPFFASTGLAPVGRTTLARTGTVRSSLLRLHRPCAGGADDLGQTTAVALLLPPARGAGGAGGGGSILNNTE